MQVYRIADCRYIADLSGTGPALYGGRWNSKNTYIVYTAASRALALLETIVHMGVIPEAGYCMAVIDIPDNSILQLGDDNLPPGALQNPPPDHIKMIGDNFIKAGKQLALKLPSAIMPEEYNYLLNPAHPDFKKVKLVSQKAISIDDRLLV